MRILLTNNTLDKRQGSELYARDLAIALLRRGHFPVAYSPKLGEVAEDMRQATIPVVDDLGALGAAPDVIHGQHHLETMTAVLRFPETPAIYVCHGWMPWEEMPPVFPSLGRYVAVDDLCRERILTTPGIPEDRVEVIYNFVDLERFGPRPALPPRPESALIYTNHGAPGDPCIEAIRSACQRFGVGRVDVVGLASGNPTAAPETILGAYDLVFAKARAALEAMATGCAVIVSDSGRLGGYVSMDNVTELRRLNFGIRAMQKATVTEESVLRELARYDAADAARVSELIRTQADMRPAVDRWVAIYDRVLVESQAAQASPATRLAAASDYVRLLSPQLKARRAAEQRAQRAEVSRACATSKLASVGAALAQREAALAQGKAELDELQAVLTELRAQLADGQAELRTQLTDGQAELAELAELRTELTDGQAELKTIYDSPGWKAITLYRRLRRWVLRL